MTQFAFLRASDLYNRIELEVILMNEYAYIRSMRSEDYALIPYVYSESFGVEPWSKNWYNIPQFNPESNWTAIKDTEIVGFLISFISKNEPYISVIAVHPEHQRNGTGERLISEAVKYWSKLDYKAIRIHVSFERKNAFELYRKIGFEVLGRDDDSYELSLTI